MSILINDVSPRVHYIATSGQTVFVVPFPWLANGDLKVYVNEQPIPFTTAPALNDQQYHTTGMGTSAGGAVVFGPPGRNPGDEVIIFRDTPIARTIDFPTSGVFPVTQLNDAFDAMTTMIQQTEVNVEKRTLGMAVNDFVHPLNRIPNRPGRAGKVLGFDHEGQPLMLNMLPTPDFIPGAVWTDDNAPPEPWYDGQLWWESDTGRLFVYYNDGTSLQWVQVNLSSSTAEGHVRPEQHGGTGNGIADDTTAILTAAAVAVSSRLPLTFSPGKTYKYSQLVLPANLVIEAVGATLRFDGVLQGLTNRTLTLGSNSSFDELSITCPGGPAQTVDFLVFLEPGCNGRFLEVVADTQRGVGTLANLGHAISSTGQDIRIEHVRVVNFNMPLEFNNSAGATQTTGSWIGFLECISYIRGFWASHCSFTLGRLHCSVLSPTSTHAAGENGLLIGGCSDWTVGDCWIADAGEHAVRIAGSLSTPLTPTYNWSIGVITAISCGGCAFKINPTADVSPGISESVINGSVAGVLGINVGNPVIGNNQELLRLTHVSRLTIGWAAAFSLGSALSAQWLLSLSDCQYVTIGELGGNNFNAAIVMNEYDIDSSTGPISDITIGRLWGHQDLGTAIGIYTAQQLARITITFDNFWGWDGFLLQWGAAAVNVLDTITFRGRVAGTVAPLIDGTPPSYVTFELAWSNRRIVGEAANSTTAIMQLVGSDYSRFQSASDTGRGLVLDSRKVTAGDGLYGMGIEGSRLGSARRGWAIAPRQASADGFKVGISMFVGNSSTTADEQLFEAARFNNTRSFGIPDGIPAPAAVGAWAQLYVDSADGDLKVIFGDGVVKTIVVDT